VGGSYQWQKFNGKDFVNIDDDPNISGASTSAVKIRNATLTVLEAFRCLIDGNYSKTYIVLKGNRWIGNRSNDWHDPENWSCEQVPNVTTDVLIEGGRKNNPVLSSNGDCRSIKLLSGANLQISSGVILTVRH
jgi:hypothetical protein